MNGLTIWDNQYINYKFLIINNLQTYQQKNC